MNNTFQKKLIMKKIILKISLMLLFFIFMGTGCKNDKYIPPSDPKEAILGKWELIAIGE